LDANDNAEIFVSTKVCCVYRKKNCYAEKTGGGRRRKDTGKLIEETAGCASVRRILSVRGFGGKNIATAGVSAPSNPAKDETTFVLLATVR
jgi:hypothetical protein